MSLPTVVRIEVHLFQKARLVAGASRVPGMAACSTSNPERSGEVRPPSHSLSTKRESSTAISRCVGSNLARCERIASAHDLRCRLGATRFGTPHKAYGRGR